ncbi:aldehyde dehydrogenase family protein [Microbacterium soli]|uniref:Aldehyde dehydrogenase (NADP(+)) n=1 Tax=Microbacterium soli TaxID=446075 RepID=A0ABP7MYS5_9MICO
MSSTTSYLPREGRPTTQVPDTRPEDVSAALSRAAAAADAVAEVSPATRRAWLAAIADALEAEVEQLASLADRETGLGMERLRTEVVRAASQLRFYGDVAEEGSYLGLTIDTAPTRIVRMARPLGPVAIFGASNFPFAFGVLGNDTASALAAGCPVVVKAHPAHPVLSDRLVALAKTALAEAGAPRGTLEAVHGLRAGRALVESEQIGAVGFTGSQGGGLALWELANARPRVIPVYAEMGTVNPVVVTPSAAVSRLADVADGFAQSFSLGFGQFCTKPGLVFVPTGHEAVQRLAAAASRTATSAVLLTEGIAQAARSGVQALIAEGAEIVSQVPGPGRGWSADTTVLTAPITALHPTSRLREECFGPVAVIVEYHDADELRHALNALQGALVGSVITDGTDADPDAGRLVESLSDMVGRVTVDDWPTSVAWTWAQHHGGPWPSTTAPAATSVGASALARWVRPVAYQSIPDAWLPEGARESNPWRIPRRVDGKILHR